MKSIPCTKRKSAKEYRQRSGVGGSELLEGNDRVVDELPRDIVRELALLLLALKLKARLAERELVNLNELLIEMDAEEVKYLAQVLRHRLEVCLEEEAEELSRDGAELDLGCIGSEPFDSELEERGEGGRSNHSEQALHDLRTQCTALGIVVIRQDQHQRREEVSGLLRDELVREAIEESMKELKDGASTSGVFIGEVGEDGIEVLLEALLTEGISDKELEEDASGQDPHARHGRLHHELCHLHHDVVQGRLQRGSTIIRTSIACYNPQMRERGIQ